MRVTMGSLKEVVQKKKKQGSIRARGPVLTIEEAEKEISNSRVEKHTATITTPSFDGAFIPPPSAEVVTIMASPSADNVVVVKAAARSTEVVQALPVQVGSGGSRAANREAVDKGKASMLSSFTANYNPNIPSEEPTVAIGMCFKVTNQALQNRQLAGELAKMVMLPTDWEARKMHPVSKI